MIFWPCILIHSVQIRFHFAKREIRFEKSRWRLKTRWRNCLDVNFKKIFVGFGVIKSKKISFTLLFFHSGPTNIQIRYNTGIIWNLAGFWIGSNCGSRYSEELVLVDLKSIIRFIFLGLSNFETQSSFQFINFDIKFNMLVIRLVWRMTYHHMLGTLFALLWGIGAISIIDGAREVTQSDINTLYSCWWNV